MDKDVGEHNLELTRTSWYALLMLDAVCWNPFHQMFINGDTCKNTFCATLDTTLKENQTGFARDSGLQHATREARTHRTVLHADIVEVLQFGNADVAEVAFLGELIHRGSRPGVEVSADEECALRCRSLYQLLDRFRNLSNTKHSCTSSWFNRFKHREFQRIAKQILTRDTAGSPRYTGGLAW